MIKVIEILLADNYYNISEEIEIFKGKNELPSSFKDFYTKIKRQIKYKK